MSLFLPHHRDWYQNYSTLQHFANNAPEETKGQLELAILQSNAKVSTLYEKTAQFFGLQSTPFLPQPCRYHRSTPNSLLDKVHQDVAQRLGLQTAEFVIVDSPLIRENITRELSPHEPPDTVTSDEQFAQLIDRILENESGYKIFDVSVYMKRRNIHPNEFRTKVIEPFSAIIEERIKLHPLSEIKNKADFDDLIGVTYYAMIEYEGAHILISSHPHSFLKDVKDIMRRSGFHLSPDQAKATLLKISGLQNVLDFSGICPLNEVEIEKIDKVTNCPTLDALLGLPAVAHFLALSQEIDPPYLQIHPAAAVNLLHGFKELHIDQEFAKRELSDLLQISYAKIVHAMEYAIANKNNLVEFRNQIELIHQEIQTWLIILQPYHSNEFEKAVLGNLQGILPADYGHATVHLKSSAMRGFSTILAGVEQQNNTRDLNVLVHKDSYYHETDETLKDNARSYNVTVFDTDIYPQTPLEDCLNKRVNKPFDLVVVEYNHNVSENRKSYRKENLLEQIKTLNAKGLLSDKCVVLIDTTICLERSEELQELFLNPEIKLLIEQGKLGITLLRSAQKFDMLGVDNYYGGIAVTINNPTAFRTFNERMDHQSDQLTGLNYQGLTHLEKHAGKEIEQFRQAVMDNTWKLFQMLPEPMIASPTNKNPIQVSRIEEKGQILLDLKFSTPEIKQAFFATLDRYTKANKLPCMMRPSFSFMYTTYILIGNVKSRITPGLEGDLDLKLYADFFQRLQEGINKNPDGFADKSIKETVMAFVKLIH